MDATAQDACLSTFKQDNYQKGIWSIERDLFHDQVKLENIIAGGNVLTASHSVMDIVDQQLVLIVYHVRH